MNLPLRNRPILALAALALALVCIARPMFAYVEIPYTLGRVIQEATQIAVLRVEKVDGEKNLIVFRKVQDLKGTAPDIVRHNIGRGGFHPREWQTIMAWAQPGQTAVFFNNGGASETCISNYWYQAYAGGEWWNMSHGEPYFLRTFAGRPEKLAGAVAALLAGQEAVVPCMADGDKNLLQTAGGRIQRMKASLKIQDYDIKRDFVGWGGEEFRRIEGMPGFTHYSALSRTDPDAVGVNSADFDGDGKPDLCLFGSGRLTLLQNAGTALNELSLPVGGARATDWADYNADGQPDLLIAGTSGLRLFTNRGSGKFADDSAGLPQEPYYNATAVAFINADADNRPDILFANGFLGLRLYKNVSAAAVEDGTPKLGAWQYLGPFDNAGGKGFDTVYPPETSLNLTQEYAGKNNVRAVWKAGAFTDKAVNSLALFPADQNSDSVVYLYRSIDCLGATDLPVSLGSDDGLAVWLNGQKLLSENVSRACTPDQTRLVLKLKPGRNHLLLKVCQGSGEWAFYFAADESQRAVPPLFADVSAAAGLGLNGLGGNLKGDHLAIADVNADGRPDFLYSAGSGLLALNTPQGFVPAANSGLQYQCGRVTPVFGDFSGDGAPDLFIPQPGGCKLYKNAGQGKFSDVTARSGELAQPFTGATSAVWVDLDHSGQPGLLIGCLYGSNRYYRCRPDNTFINATRDVGLHQRVFNTRGVAVADLNRDGAVDVVFNNEGQESCVLLGNATIKVGRSPEPAKTTARVARAPGGRSVDGQPRAPRVVQ